MRVKRLKHCRKHIAFYKSTFGFRAPFQILVDLTFCQHALMCKINIREQMSNYITDGEVQLFTTKCILEEGKLLGPQLHGALLICKQFKLRKCNHTSSVPAQQCIEDMIGAGNSHHLFVASQDHELQVNLRNVPGVPILRIHYHALVLEKPNQQSRSKAHLIGDSKSDIAVHELQRIAELKKLHNINQKREREPKPKKVKGVNPLAMKKKKKKETPVVGKQTSESSKNRRKKKKKVAAHVLDELQKKCNT